MGFIALGPSQNAPRSRLLVLLRAFVLLPLLAPVAAREPLLQELRVAHLGGRNGWSRQGAVGREESCSWVLTWSEGRLR